MNPTPPWSLRDVASETLFDMIILKCSWRALLHLFCVGSWWVYHHDIDRSHSWCAFFVKETQRRLLASVSLWGILLHRSHRDISRNLVPIPPRSERFPLTHDDWHGGSHPRVSSFSDGTSHRLCVAHSYICSVCSCDEHHTIIIFGGGARSSFFVEMMRYFLFVRRFQWSSPFRLRCLVPWWTPFHQDVKRIAAHKFGWHGVFLLAKRSHRWSVLHVHSVVLWYTLITMTLAGRLFRNVCWHDCLCFISRSPCVRIVWSCGEPHTTVTESRSPRSLETHEGSVGLQAPVIISASFALYGPVTNTLPLFFRE